MSKLTLVLVLGMSVGVLQAATEAAKLTASDAAAADQFGGSVSVSGNVALVGAQLGDSGVSDSGSAYVYRYDGGSWMEEAELTASDGAAFDRFGTAVSISGDVALVGAYLDDDDGTSSGSAYVFRYNGSTWVEEAKLTASDGETLDFFGYSVSVSGDVALVGAYLDDNDGGSDSGSAYVFRYNGSAWVEEAKLTASDTAASYRFGWSVSVSGDVVLVGAYQNSSIMLNAGSAYVYRYDGSTWVEEAKLTASDGETLDFFGYSVSVSGNVALLGAVGDDDVGSSSGSAYVFRYNGSAWVEEAKLTASDGAAGDNLGLSVSVEGEAALVGVPLDDDGGSNSGSAYVFRYNGSAWVEETKLTASDAVAGDSFGESVSISGSVALAGARLDDDAGSHSGSAYVFSPKLINISTRGQVQTGEKVIIGGFWIGGTEPKTVVLRARGPSMGDPPFNLPGTLPDPLMQLFSGSTVIAQNDDWQSTDPLCTAPAVSCGDFNDIIASGLDPCQPNPGETTPPTGCNQESALYVTLPPGGYTAIVSGAGGGTGVGLVEVFEADSTPVDATLVNISTRGMVLTGNDVMIGGFWIGGPLDKSVVLRARGPSMGGAPFFVPGVLPDPEVQLYSGSTDITQDVCVPLPISDPLHPCVPNPGESTPPPGCNLEEALMCTVPPGGYTAIVSGAGGGSGVGLVEVFETMP